MVLARNASSVCVCCVGAMSVFVCKAMLAVFVVGGRKALPLFVVLGEKGVL